MPADGDRRLEAVGLRHRPHGHEAAVAAAGEPEARLVDGRRLYRGIDAGQNVAQVAVAEIADVGAVKRSPCPKLPRGLGRNTAQPRSSRRPSDPAREARPRRRRRPAVHEVTIGSLPSACPATAATPGRRGRRSSNVTPHPHRQLSCRRSVVRSCQ